MRRSSRRRASRELGLLGLLTVVASLTLGCNLNMVDQPKYEPLEASDFFEDGMSARTPPEGTVPHGWNPADATLATAGSESQELPVAISEKLLARGRDRYGVYCTPCHDLVGTGRGMIVQRGFKKPASFHEPRLREAPAGYFFDVITNGFGNMPAYAVHVTPSDRWAIVAWIRALQLSQHAPVTELGDGDRARLQELSTSATEVP